MEPFRQKDLQKFVCSTGAVYSLLLMFSVWLSLFLFHAPLPFTRAGKLRKKLMKSKVGSNILYNIFFSVNWLQYFNIIKIGDWLCILFADENLKLVTWKRLLSLKRMLSVFNSEAVNSVELESGT